MYIKRIEYIQGVLFLKEQGDSFKNTTRADLRKSLNLYKDLWFLFWFKYMNYDDIFTFENLYKAHLKARLSKRDKKEVIEFELNTGSNISKLHYELKYRKYKISGYNTFYIYEPKERRVDALSYRDRIVQHCICDNFLTPLLEKRLIYDNDGYNDRILYDESTNTKYIQYRICGDVEIKEKNKYSYQGEYKCYWVNYHSVANDGGFDMIFTDFEVYFNKEMWINMDQEAEANLFYSTNNRYKLNDIRVPIEYSSIMETLEDHTLAKADINVKEAKHIYANRYTCDYTMYSNDYYYEIAEYNDKLYLTNYEEDYRGVYYELDAEYTNILKNILDLK